MSGLGPTHADKKRQLRRLNYAKTRQPCRLAISLTSSAREGQEGSLYLASLAAQALADDVGPATIVPTADGIAVQLDLDLVATIEVASELIRWEEGPSGPSEVLVDAATVLYATAADIDAATGLSDAIQPPTLRIESAAAVEQRSVGHYAELITVLVWSADERRGRPMITLHRRYYELEQGVVRELLLSEWEAVVDPVIVVDDGKGGLHATQAGYAAPAPPANVEKLVGEDIPVILADALAADDAAAQPFDDYSELSED